VTFLNLWSVILEMVSSMICWDRFCQITSTKHRTWAMEMDDYKASPHLIPDIPGILVESPSKSQECRFALSMLTGGKFASLS